MELNGSKCGRRHRSKCTRRRYLHQNFQEKCHAIHAHARVAFPLYKPFIREGSLSSKGVPKTTKSIFFVCPSFIYKYQCLWFVYGLGFFAVLGMRVFSVKICFYGEAYKSLILKDVCQLLATEYAVFHADKWKGYL